MTLDAKSDKLLGQLQDKMSGAGQNMPCHLEGLVHARFQTYWDYIGLDILLKLQRPCTTFCDEKIFLTYHQITELYFKLILQEIGQITGPREASSAEFVLRLNRINRYLENLVFSFDIMVDGLDHDQFMMFRTALTPASGFQSVQYRLIEISSTLMRNLLVLDKRQDGEAMNVSQQYAHVYWKSGAIDKTSGRKDLSLTDFEDEYDGMLLEKAKEYSQRNIAFRWEKFTAEDEYAEEMCSALRRFDHLMNIEWRLAHFRSAVRHLRTPTEAVRATGGTNWQTYLPPRFQKIMFFPTLWSDAEKENWGKSFIEHHLFTSVPAEKAMAHH